MGGWGLYRIDARGSVCRAILIATVDSALLSIGGEQ